MRALSSYFPLPPLAAADWARAAKLADATRPLLLRAAAAWIRDAAG
jgi:hypothetical protein